MQISNQFDCLASPLLSKNVLHSAHYAKDTGNITSVRMLGGANGRKAFKHNATLKWGASGLEESGAAPTADVELAPPTVASWVRIAPLDTAGIYEGVARHFQETHKCEVVLEPMPPVQAGPSRLLAEKKARSAAAKEKKSNLVGKHENPAT